MWLDARSVVIARLPPLAQGEGEVVEGAVQRRAQVAQRVGARQVQRAVQVAEALAVFCRTRTANLTTLLF